MTVLPFARTPADESVGRPDDAGYGDFYARYRRPLVAYVGMSFRDVDVESVVQDAFCRALAHWSEVGRMRNPWPWLAVTARNLARNNIRDEARTRAVGLRVCDSVHDSAPDLDEQVEATDHLRLLGRAMRGLTPLQRQFLRLLVEEGLSTADAGRRLGLKPGAARMHVCRMRTRLAEQFLGLGGRLALAPLALLGAVLRRLRAAGSASRRTTGSAGTTGTTTTAGTLGASAVATSMIAATLGFSHLALAPDQADASTRPLVHTSSASVREAAAVRHEQRHRDARRVARGSLADGSNPSARRLPSVTTPAVPATHQVAVSKNPTQSGATATVDVTVTLPLAGKNHIAVNLQQYDDMLTPACDSVGADCP